MTWLISNALMNSLCLQEQAGEFSEGICSDGEQSALSSLSPTPQAYLCSDKTTGFSRLSRYGMTLGHLTADRGEELLTLYRGGFPARTLALQEKGQGSTASDQGYGKNLRGSLAKYDRDSRSWKTHQFSLLGELTELLEIWPRWGTIVNGELYQRPTLVRLISEKESGSWRTPNTDGYRSDGLRILARRVTDEREFMGMSRHAARSKAGKCWPTPTRRDYKSDQFTPEYRALRDSMTKGKTLPWVVGGPLNPPWVEWLMGWPEGWTDLKPLETDKFRKWLQQHGEY